MKYVTRFFFFLRMMTYYFDQIYPTKWYLERLKHATKITGINRFDQDLTYTLLLAHQKYSN